MHGPFPLKHCDPVVSFRCLLNGQQLLVTESRTSWLGNPEEPMALFEPKPFHNLDEFRRVVPAFHAVNVQLLFEFARRDRSVKDMILTNFIARTDTLLRSALLLTEAADVPSGFVLFRCLLDRLFHLAELDANSAFEDFEEWSFLEQFEAQNKVLSVKEFSEARLSKAYLPTSDEKTRYKELIKRRSQWRRPKAEAVAERIGLKPLYSFGYDFASMHVHPMANDGLQDFHEITGLKPAPPFPDGRMLMANFILVSAYTVNLCLRASGYDWRVAVADFYEGMVVFVEEGSHSYLSSFRIIGEMVSNSISLGEPNAVRSE
jgi:hypothetical protein